MWDEEYLEQRQRSRKREILKGVQSPSLLVWQTLPWLPFIPYCYGLNVTPVSSYIEVLTPSQLAH